MGDNPTVIKAAKAGIMAVRDAHNWVYYSRPMHMMPKSAAQH